MFWASHHRASLFGVFLLGSPDVRASSQRPRRLAGFLALGVLAFSSVVPAMRGISGG
jgi:hypothetical protein